VDDLFIQFSTINQSNHNSLRNLPSVLSEGNEIPVKIKRRDQVFDLKLTPRSGWGGRGMLG